MITTREYLQAKLLYEIDVQAVFEGLMQRSFTLADTRKKRSWDHGHVLGAQHLPVENLGPGVFDRIPIETELVVYGWGPGCNGATRTAYELVELGYSVREMIGGFEYWCRAGLAIETATGIRQLRADPLVAADGDIPRSNTGRRGELPPIPFN